MAMAALPLTSSGLSPLAVPGAALCVAASRRAFLRIPAAAHAPAPAPLRCSHNHADFVTPLSKAQVPAVAADMMEVHGPPADDMRELRVRTADEHGPAAAALKDMIADAFRPLLDNFHQLRSLWTIFDTEDYHIGMPYGALVANVACYQLWKMDPSTFLDAALGYAFYKLSVVASKVRRQGFSNDMIARVKFVLLVIWAAKDHHRANSLPYITYPVWLLYLTTFIFDVGGLKKEARGILPWLVASAVAG